MNAHLNEHARLATKAMTPLQAWQKLDQMYATTGSQMAKILSDRLNANRQSKHKDTSAYVQFSQKLQDHGSSRPLDMDRPQRSSSTPS
jgi:hypothetical protein